MRKPVRSPIRRRQPTQRRAQETVEAILDAVIQLLKRGGVAVITTNSIAEKAGVSIGSVYQYFPNKQAIFIALHERHIEQVDRVLRRKISESEGETLDRLVSHLIDGMIEAHASDPELATLLDSEVPHRADRAKEFSLRLYEPLREALVPHAESRGGAVKLDVRAFLLGNMLDTFGHAVVLRRPRGYRFEAQRRRQSRRSSPPSGPDQANRCGDRQRIPPRRRFSEVHRYARNGPAPVS